MISIPTRTDGLTPYYTQRVNLDGQDFNLNFRWSTRAERWYLDLYDSAGEPLVLGMKLVCGWPVTRYYHGRAGMPAGDFWVLALAVDQTPPGLLDFGIGLRCELVYFSAGELGG